MTRRHAAALSLQVYNAAGLLSLILVHSLSAVLIRPGTSLRLRLDRIAGADEPVTVNGLPVTIMEIGDANPAQ